MLARRCWQLQALWSEIHHLQQTACLDAFVWGQEIGEVIAPSWCSSSLHRLLADKMKATPIISENTPDELSWASGGASEEPPPTPRIITRSPFCVYAWWYKKILSISLSLFLQSEMRLWLTQCAGAIEVTSKSIGLPPPNLVTAVLITWSCLPEKKKSECPGLRAHRLRSPPLLSTPRLRAEAIFFFLPSFHRASRGGTGDVEWWTGVQALCCSALHWRRSLICITVPHMKDNTHTTHTHTSQCSTRMAAPPPTRQPSPPRPQSRSECLSHFLSFYRGRVLSLASGAASPGLTWEGKSYHASAQTFTSPLRWCQTCTLPHGEYTSRCNKRGLLQEI